jgi:hypothetical protein
MQRPQGRPPGPLLRIEHTGGMLCTRMVGERLWTSLVALTAKDKGRAYASLSATSRADD